MTTKKLAPATDTVAAPAKPKRRKAPKRSQEELLQALQEKQRALAERTERATRRLEAEERKIVSGTKARKLRMQKQLQFQAAVARVAPEFWDEAHYIAAIERALDADPEELHRRGEELLQQLGTHRRGGPRKYLPEN